MTIPGPIPASLYGMGYAESWPGYIVLLRLKSQLQPMSTWELRFILFQSSIATRLQRLPRICTSLNLTTLVTVPALRLFLPL